MSLTSIISKCFTNFYSQLIKNYVNNLTSNSDNLALAASQGKVLNDKIEKLVPIGYVFIWNNIKVQDLPAAAILLNNTPDLTTAQAVHDYFGFGTWEQVTDAFLYGSSASGGGSRTVTLTTNNLPPHTHSIPSLTGRTTGNDDGGHTHLVKLKYDNDATVTGKAARANSGGGQWSGGNSEEHAAGKTTPYEGGVDGGHIHNICTNTSTSGQTGSGSAINIMPPHKGVYMWQRIA